MQRNANAAVFVYQICVAAVVSARWGTKSRMSERSCQATVSGALEVTRQIAAKDIGIANDVRDGDRFALQEPLHPDNNALNEAPDVGWLGFAGAAVLLVVLVLIAALLPYT
jgi:hypothetical protein